MLHKANVLISGTNALSTSAEIVLAGRHERIWLTLKNNDGSIAMYVGPDSGVTSLNGFLLSAGETLRMEGYNGPLYMIAASGTPTVSFAEW